MKKLLLLTGLILLAAACNRTADPPAAQQPLVYTNAEHGVEFEYPEEFDLTEPNYAALDNKIAQVQIPSSVYPDTNLVDAAFSVSQSPAADLETCLNLAPPQNSMGFHTTAEINGVEFHRTTSVGAGAGNLYESIIYRTMRNGACWEISQTIHTGNIGNYPEGSVTEVDKSNVQFKLDQVLQSFEFTR